MNSRHIVGSLLIGFLLGREGLKWWQHLIYILIIKAMLVYHFWPVLFN